MGKLREDNEKLLTPKDKLLALKLIKECDEGKFSLFKDGPSIMKEKLYLVLSVDTYLQRFL